MTVKRSTPVRVDKLRQAAKEMNGKTLRVGWFKKHRYPADRGGHPIAYIAAIMEKGTIDQGGDIPPRPVMIPLAKEERGNWMAMMGRGVKRVTDGTLTAKQLMQQLGLHIEGQIKQGLIEIQTPELADSTLRARARRRRVNRAQLQQTKPRIDTGLMINSVTSQVSDDGGDE